MSTDAATGFPPRVVFDTGNVVAAAFNPFGVAMRTLQLMQAGEIIVFMSNRLRHEYEATLRNPVHQRRYPFLTEAYIDSELARLDIFAERLPNPLTVLAYPRDPNDEILVNLTVAVKADYLVTLDGDLLDLPKHPDFPPCPTSRRY